jgi:hypothetical protein
MPRQVPFIEFEIQFVKQNVKRVCASQASPWIEDQIDVIRDRGSGLELRSKQDTLTALKVEEKRHPPVGCMPQLEDQLIGPPGKPALEFMLFEKLADNGGS